MREKLIDIAFIYNNLISLRVLAVTSNIRLAITPRNEDDFTVKEFEYFSGAAPSKIDNHADTHGFRRNFRAYFTMSKRCTVSLSYPIIPRKLMRL